MREALGSVARVACLWRRLRRAGWRRVVWELLAGLRNVAAAHQLGTSLYDRLIAMLVARCGLFDVSYYVRTNPDVAQCGVRPALHYVRYGEREGRCPMPLFDPHHYRKEAGPIVGRVSPLLHYAWIGRRLGLSPHRWFDPSYYRAQRPQIAPAHAVEDFLYYGGRVGLSPCAEFDSGYYLERYSDVVAAGINPLVHYLEAGKQEGRKSRDQLGRETDAEFVVRAVPPLPETAEWDACAPRAERVDGQVDVVVPVYGGRAETLCCLLSVLRSHCTTPFTLVVIDDRGPDPELAADLDSLAARGLFVLIRNERNLGFVHSANRGLMRSPGRDVVLLNADTEVCVGWLDRLRRAAYAQAGVASVTPLSNSATICSYPYAQRDNPWQLEVDVSALDSLAAELNAGKSVVTPSGVGFCLYLTRHALDAVGVFDAETFGAGYGEENDWCQRAISKGFVNLITADVYVWHWGSVSFSVSKAARVARAMELIDLRYPRYHRNVADFIASDPLRAARQSIDRARLAAQCGLDAVLLLCHRRGGGTERQVRAEIAQLAASGRTVYRLRPSVDEPDKVQLDCAAAPLTPNLPNWPLNASDLVSTLRELRVRALYVHSLIDFGPYAPSTVRALAHTLGAALHLRVHDYEALCPRITLTGPDGLYCGEPDVAGCNRCLRSNGSEFDAHDIVLWREPRMALFESAVEVLVPDADVAARIARRVSLAKLRVKPHEELLKREASSAPPILAVGEALRIVVIGAISRTKGYEVLRACAQDARIRGLPLEFLLMGYSMDDVALGEAGVRVAGRYRDERGLEVLRALHAHVAWLPSTWPETYSFTLSLALDAGLQVFAFDIGAIAGRLRAAGAADLLMPISIARDPRSINERFDEYRRECLAMSAQAMSV